MSTTHAEKRNMPYSSEQLFKLVSDVERYPEFLPWCLGCKITRHIKTSEEASPQQQGYNGLINVTDPRFHGDASEGKGSNNSEVKEIFMADLVVGYKMVREKFTSKVTLEKHNLVHVEYVSGPMKHLSNHWKFISEDDGSCTIDFYVDFEFKNRLLQNLIGAFFTEAMQRMVRAFEGRAKELYGSNNINKQT